MISTKSVFSVIQDLGCFAGPQEQLSPEACDISVTV